MEKVADYSYTTRSSSLGTTTFRIRHYRPPISAVIIATAPQRSEVAIDPDIDSYLAAEIAALHRDFLPEGLPFVWIAHTADDAFARVRFEWLHAHAVVNHGIHRQWFGIPQRHPMTREEIEAMIQERLL